MMHKNFVSHITKVCVRLFCERKSTSLSEPFVEQTRQKSVHLFTRKFYTYSFHKTVWNAQSVRFGFSKWKESLSQNHRGIKTQVNVSDFQKIAPTLKKLPTALSKMRPRKKVMVKDLEKDLKLAVAYPISEELDLEYLAKVLRKHGLYNLSQRPEDMNDALHLTSKYTVDDHHQHKEFFLFREGSLVCWDVPELERRELVNFLVSHMKEHYSLPMITDEHDESMEFSVVENGSKLINGKFLVKSTEKEINLDKYAFSNALSHSVKLSIWESSLDELIDSIEYLSDELREGKKFSMPKPELRKKLGEIFALRHLVNLSSDLLDIPDFYWDREDLERIYKSSYLYLNIGKRTTVINKKLDHCAELLELVDSKDNDAKHTRLEWIIIILIAIEVIFALPVCIREWSEFLFSSPIKTDS